MIVIVIVILVLFLLIGQSTYKRATEAIESADSTASAGCGCAGGMLAIVLIGVVTLAAMASIMGGGL